MKSRKVNLPVVSKHTEWQINTQIAVEELELRKKVDGICEGQGAIENMLRNTVYCRWELSRT